MHYHYNCPPTHLPPTLPPPRPLPPDLRRELAGELPADQKRCTSLHACIHACMPAGMHTYIHACMHAYRHTYVHACISTYMHHICVGKCSHACMHSIPACKLASIHKYMYAHHLEFPIFVDPGWLNILLGPCYTLTFLTERALLPELL